MKRFSFFAAIALVALAGCAKQESAKRSDAETPISFNPLSYKVASKADITGTTYATTQDFDVWAVYTGETDFAYNAAGGAAFMSGVEQEYKADKNAWGTKTGAYYWPKAGKLSFWAVSPASTSATVNLTAASKTIAKTGWTLTNADPDYAKDIMFSDIVANKTNDDYKGHGVDDTVLADDTGFGDYQGVNILFHHALSRIEFKAKKGARVNSSETLTLTNITITGAKSVGDVTVTAPGVLTEGASYASAFTAGDANVVWANQATPLNLTPLTSETDALTTDAVVVGSDRLVIPQTTKDVVSFTVTVKSTIGGVSATKDYTYQLGEAHNNVWKWGKKYIYTIILNEDDIYFDPAVVDWDSDEYIFPDLVVLDKTHLELTAGGSTGTLTATVYPTEATDKTLTWTSSNESVATVADGVVTPVAAGDAIITVTTKVGGHTATCLVSVTAAP